MDLFSVEGKTIIIHIMIAGTGYHLFRKSGGWHLGRHRPMVGLQRTIIQGNKNTIQLPSANAEYLSFRNQFS